MDHFLSAGTGGQPGTSFHHLIFKLFSDRLIEAAQAKAYDIEKDILELKHQKRQVLNSIMTGVANLRSLIQMVNETEEEQDKISFLKRRSVGQEGES